MPEIDKSNPNSLHFHKPYYAARPAMREQTQSQRTRATQNRLATIKPAKITLPTPDWEKEA